MARELRGAITPGTYELKTVLNAVTATTTSESFSVAGAKKITLFLTRADHSSGSSVFIAEVSGDDSTYVTCQKLVSHITNSNSQQKTRVASLTLSSDVTELISVDLENDSYISMRINVTETTDGTHTARVLIEY